MKKRESAKRFVFLIIALAIVIMGLPVNAITPEEMRANCGLALVEPDPAQVSPYLVDETRADWFNWFIYGFVSPVKNQAGCGACYAFASIAALETDILAKYNDHPMPDLSEQTLVGPCPEYCINHCDFDPHWYNRICHFDCSAIGYCTTGGDLGAVALEFAYAGVPSEVCNPFQYRDDGCTAMSCSRWLTRTYRVGGGWVYDPADFSQTREGIIALLETGLYSFGPIVVSMQVFPGFEGWMDSEPYKAPPGSHPVPDPCSHAVTLVGYDSDFRFFWAKNSWGTFWGNQGFFRISYDEVHDPQGEFFDPYNPCLSTTTYTHLGYNSIVYNWQSVSLPQPHIEGKVAGSYGPAFPNANVLAKQGSTIVDQYPSDSNGNYPLSVPANQTYTVTATEPTGSYTFNSLSVPVGSADVMSRNLTATGKYAISGTVLLNGQGLQGATITVNGPTNTGTVLVQDKTVTTDSQGEYTFPHLGNGTYTVAAQKSGYRFPSPLTVTISGGNQINKNFSAITFSISGTVSGATQSGVTMNLTGASTGSTITDASGNYTFSGLINGTYTVTPVKGGYSFSPSSITVEINGASQTGKNFTATALPCILTCTATVFPRATTLISVPFFATATASNCTASPTFAWNFGDGSASTQQNPSHGYTAAGTYTWALTVTAADKSCTQTGTIIVTSCSALPGDCDGNNAVSIGEVQQAINMFLGLAAPGCGANCNGDSQISIGEVQKAINSFLGLPSCCSSFAALAITAAPDISIGSAAGAPGSTVSVPVTLSTNGAGVCAASFKATFDPALLTFASVTSGPAATAAGKNVSSNLNASTNTITLGVIGNNQNLMNDGIIAYLNFTVLPNAGGAVALGGSCGAADRDGNDLPSQCNGGSVLTGYSISGTVDYLSYPVSGVKLTLKQGDTVVSTVYSESDGSFSFRGIANGSYTIYPSKSCTYFCSPTSSCDPSQAVAVNGASISGFSISAVSQATTCCISTLRQQVFECGACVPSEFQSAVINVRTCLQSATGADGSPIFNAVLLASTAIRAEGQPAPQSFSFEVEKVGDYYINVINGDPEDKGTLVSSATVGIEPLGAFFGPSDFNKGIELMVKPVHLEPGFYSIETEVRSQPGSYMTIVVCDKDFSKLPALP